MKILESMKENKPKKDGKYICYNTESRDLPDIYALTLGHCAPSDIVRIYQANPSLLCYNIYIYAFLTLSQDSVTISIKLIWTCIMPSTYIYFYPYNITINMVVATVYTKNGVQNLCISKHSLN